MRDRSEKRNYTINMPMIKLTMCFVYQSKLNENSREIAEELQRFFPFHAKSPIIII